MNQYIITIESGSDLTLELFEHYNIHVIPMHVMMGKEIRPDGSFPIQELFDFYEKTGELPKTSSSTPKEIISNLLNENGVLSPTWIKTGAVISSYGGTGGIGIAGIEKQKQLK